MIAVLLFLLAQLPLSQAAARPETLLRAGAASFPMNNSVSLLEFRIPFAGGSLQLLHDTDATLATKLRAAVSSLSAVNGSAAVLTNVTVFNATVTEEEAAAAVMGSLDMAVLTAAAAASPHAVETAAAASLTLLNSGTMRRMLGQVHDSHGLNCARAISSAAVAISHHAQPAAVAGRRRAAIASSQGAVVVPLLLITVRLQLPTAYIRTLGNTMEQGTAVGAAAAKLAADAVLSNAVSAEAALGPFAAHWSAATGFAVTGAQLGARMQSSSQVVQSAAAQATATPSAPASLSADSAADAGPPSGTSSGLQPGAIAAFAVWGVILAAAAACFVVLYRRRRRQRQSNGRRRQSAGGNLRSAPSFLSVLRERSFQERSESLRRSASTGAADLAAASSSSGSTADGDDPLVIWRHNPSRHGGPVPRNAPATVTAAADASSGVSRGTSLQVHVSVAPGAGVAEAAAATVPAVFELPLSFPSSLSMSSIVAFHVGMVRVDAVDREGEFDGNTNCTDRSEATSSDAVRRVGALPEAANASVKDHDASVADPSAGDGAVEVQVGVTVTTSLDGSPKATPRMPSVSEPNADRDVTVMLDGSPTATPRPESLSQRLAHMQPVDEERVEAAQRSSVAPGGAAGVVLTSPVQSRLAAATGTATALTQPHHGAASPESTATFRRPQAVASASTLSAGSGSSSFAALTSAEDHGDSAFTVITLARPEFESEPCPASSVAVSFDQPGQMLQVAGASASRRRNSMNDITVLPLQPLERARVWRASAQAAASAGGSTSLYHNVGLLASSLLPPASGSSAFTASKRAGGAAAASGVASRAPQSLLAVSLRLRAQPDRVSGDGIVMSSEATSGASSTGCCDAAAPT